MNTEWSELNKTMQAQLRKKDSFASGIDTLFELRRQLLETIAGFRKLPEETFIAMPYINAKGYHNKTIAYSLWHIFRIEDIVAHALITDTEQVFFSGDYQKRINSPIITTGNELFKEKIREFSKQLSLDELYCYINEVYESTNAILKSLSFEDMKTKITEEKRQKLFSLNVVSEDENAFWLVDYWCSKDIRGLIQMPFSRHHIMHIEACLRIIDKLSKK